MRMIAALLMAMLVTSFACTTPAQADDCGIAVNNYWHWCEYRAADGSKQVRDWPCMNGDTLAISLVLDPGCYLNSGVITATAIEPKFAYDVAWLSRPKFIRFNGMNSVTTIVRVNAIQLFTNDAKATVEYVPVQVTPVSARSAAIADDLILWVPWAPTYIAPPPDGGKG